MLINGITMRMMIEQSFDQSFLSTDILSQPTQNNITPPSWGVQLKDTKIFRGLAVYQMFISKILLQHDLLFHIVVV